jgi:hypothetical protein
VKEKEKNIIIEKKERKSTGKTVREKERRTKERKKEINKKRKKTKIKNKNKKVWDDDEYLLNERHKKNKNHIEQRGEKESIFQ